MGGWFNSEGCSAVAVPLQRAAEQLERCYSLLLDLVTALFDPAAWLFRLPAGVLGGEQDLAGGAGAVGCWRPGCPEVGR